MIVSLEVMTSTRDYRDLPDATFSNDAIAEAIAAFVNAHRIEIPGVEEPAWPTRVARSPPAS